MALTKAKGEGKKNKGFPHEHLSSLISYAPSLSLSWTIVLHFVSEKWEKNFS